MPPVLDAPLRAASARLRRSGVLEFFRWWRDELVDMLPAPIKTWLQREPDRIVISREGNEAFAVYASGTDRNAPAFRLSGDEDGVNASAELARLKANIEEKDVPVVLMLEPTDILARRLNFPLAVEANLRQVLNFEMDRQTPFKADQVYFDFQIAARDEQQRLLHVDLVLALRSHVDPIVAALRKRIDQPLDQIDALRAGTARWGVNLLPMSVRPPRNHFWLKVNLGLAALAFVLFWIVMAQAEARKTRAVEEFNTRIEAVREDARAAAALKQELADARDASSFLARKRLETPAFLEILEDVTRLLPDDVWLERMMLAQDELQLQGQAKESSKLINVLTKSKLLSNPQMRGPVQVDPRTNKERFSIAATQKKRTATAAAPAASAQPKQEASNAKAAG
jgi:general secretion pathway protein L